MKKLLLPFLLLLAFSTKAQYNNSWIDYSKTYYKFRLAKDTLCRIPQAALVSAGLGNVNADNFQLWRNGEQVRMYTSVSNAPFGSSDYIEFWGQVNDGKPDKKLYRDQDLQLADKYSLETDTVAYFLTTNTSGGNMRYTAAVNASPSATTPDAYFMRTENVYFKTQINRGFAYPIGEYVYSSAYDIGEGWTSGDIAPNFDLTLQINNLNVYTAGPPNSLSLRINAAGSAPNERYVRVRMYADSVYGFALPFFSYKKGEITGLPLSNFQSTSFVTLSVGSVYPNIPAQDRFVVASIGITYPAKFIFNNQKNFPFELSAAPAGNNLLIENFNYGSVAPILYDQTEGKRYIGDITSTPGKVRFVLPPSTQPSRQFVLINQEAPSVDIIPALVQRNFVNLTNTSNQGDYIIISHPALYNDGNGNNYVDQFRQYRSSAAGGSFNTKVYDINELTDQFGFGIKRHPSAIRDFILYSNTQFAVKPKYSFLIGRGMNYMDQRIYESNPVTEKIDLLPTFGWPASDMLLASVPGTVGPVYPIGRLAAITGTEVNNYLQKVIQYEQVQASSSPYIADKAWMKNVLHVAGGKDSAENNSFLQYMRGYERIVEDTLYGGKVETFSKTTTGAVQEANSNRIEQLFNEGLGLIAYFGHSSANTFEFNLSDPSAYNNTAKYPFFTVSGCSAGNFYIFDPIRLSGNLSLSEKYILTPQKGSIGFLADTHFGVPPFLDNYNTKFYTEFSRTLYGNTVGNQIRKVLLDLGGLNPNLDYFSRVHAEEIALHGDPAIRINSFAKPDYVIEDQLIKISPGIISVADNDFKVNVYMQNQGRATSDSIWVSVKRKLPNDTIKVLYNQLIPAIKYRDSINLVVPINQVTDKGLNQLIVSLDYTNRVDELYESNNMVTKDFYVFEDELRPVYPYDYSIINTQNITYVGSTANPASGQRQYVMEVDTTELFNSAFKKTYNTTGPGGIVQFTPTNLTFIDSTVYYWRLAMVPTGTAQYIWNNASFIYLPNGGTGFNQSHYFQHLKSTYTNIKLDEDRKFKFINTPRSLTFRTGLFPYYDYDKINVNLDFNQVELYGCAYNSLQFYVFDPVTLKAWDNYNVNSTNGRFGSWRVCQSGEDTVRHFFEFPYTTRAYRNAAMAFIDAVPDGMYIGITNLGNSLNNTNFIQQWQADQTSNGPGNSLYHKLKSIGFNQIDSFTHNIPFLYFYKKGDASYTPGQVVGLQDSTYIDQSFVLNSINIAGSIESVVYGPAKRWTAMHWRGSSTDPNPQRDSVKIEVWGVKQDGTSDKLATVAPAQDSTLSFVNPLVYPYLKLKMLNTDATYLTPNQLRYLRVNAEMVPEGAVAPNLYYSSRDTVEQGENVNFSLAFKNISQTPFDSLLKVKFSVRDRNNIDHFIDIPKRKALVSGDTLRVDYTINTASYPGTNTIALDFNPDNDQREQYHFNNVFYKELFVKEDKFNPLLDVTFDAVHILNKDIVASKPGILIKLKDESRYLALKDTSLLKVQVRFPDLNQTLKTYTFDNDTMRFNPANLSAGENTASIDFKPYFPEDGEYELIVSGKDANGNTAGDLNYSVKFSVINKPMISNMLNYPNPFTTSTAFVFTVTGTEVPQNVRIQILTITGKIVREITKDELGPIHVGRNITEFKWDGTDMYGQKLANGVYLYRVLTNLNGKSLDKYKAEGDNTDKFFNKGYGKMYLLR